MERDDIGTHVTGRGRELQEYCLRKTTYYYDYYNYVLFNSNCDMYWPSHGIMLSICG